MRLCVLVLVNRLIEAVAAQGAYGMWLSILQKLCDEKYRNASELYLGETHPSRKDNPWLRGPSETGASESSSIEKRLRSNKFSPGFPSPWRDAEIRRNKRWGCSDACPRFTPGPVFIPGLPRSHPRGRMGGLRQTAFRRTRAGLGLRRALYSSSGNLQ